MNRTTLLVLVILLSFALGVAAMWGYQQSQQASRITIDDNFYNEVFDDRFFRHSRSPFAEMQRIRERMSRLLGQHHTWPDFDHWFEGRFGDFPNTRLSMAEDEAHLYYLLDVDEQEVANIDVSTSDDYVRITAELSRQDGSMASTTSINQQFPVPANVEADSVRVEHLDGQIRISFDKTT